MKVIIKFSLNLICQVLVLPFALICKLEEMLGDSEVVFNLCAQFMAILPGLPGSFLRRAFYTYTLDDCSPHCHIGFGTIFSHRTSSVAKHVYIGNYALIGSACFGENALIGSRASILSGKELHVMGSDGSWTAYDAERLSTVTIGKNVWVGEGSIIMADIGEGSMVGAGSVVSMNIKPRVVVSGNPARFVRKLEEVE